ncbi:DNA cytosine methyltransferase [Oerskovia rustica]|uniref:DNA (cytosine-5-)-methyltransferase n=1 Tax=Oerskovia rustica TaxID=2762237 RepID=A0ABR8RPM2_9CELL|nr:DNA cytosine methyltransferase [Oerskovia rustica]MBD7949743.1 DNA cytosine methyltransferase [Oerskovia rustica]
MVSAPHVPEPITVLDLFAGCGGLTEGFHQFRPEGIGETDPPVFRSVGAVEWDPAAAASYAMNFGASSLREQWDFEPTEIFQEDIIGWTPKWGPGEIDVVVGGPPCQGFSGLNRNKVGAERNTLWQEFIRIVVAVQPKVFIIENVDRFVRSPEFSDLLKRMGSGDLQNYEPRDAPGTKADDPPQRRASRYLLNAADYGALQARRRAIFIGVRTDVSLRTARMQYPEPKFSKELLENQDLLVGLDLPEGKEAWRTVDELFERTRSWDLGRTELLPRSRWIAEVDEEFQGPFTTQELHFTRKPEAISVARYNAIPRNGNRKSLRGRFWCRFDDGDEVLMQKDAAYRDDDGRLVPWGSYTEVVGGGFLGTRTFTVNGFSEPHLLRGRSGRSKAEAFRVEIEDDGRTRGGILAYLSTESWDKHDAGAGDVMGRLRANSPSVTIRTEFFKPEKGRYLHPSEGRPITHYEAAHLQGFPDDFLWCGSKTQIARQIGNAVPIPLGRAIASAIYDYLRAGRLEPPGEG